MGWNIRHVYNEKMENRNNGRKRTTKPGKNENARRKKEN